MRLIAFLIFSLCLFDSALASEVIADFGPEFFGLASAPGHAEDKLEDGWQRFANEGKVAAYNNVDNPEKRLWFWTEPQVELSWAEKAGIGVYRMGVDWGRLTPNDPF